MGGRVKIFNVITKLSMGGAQETALRYCAALDPTRWETALVTGPDSSPEGDLFDEAHQLGVRVITVPTLRRRIRPLRDVGALVTMVRLFRRMRPDIVHTHSSKAGLVGRAAARLAGVPVIVHTVHGWSFHSGMPPLVARVIIASERVIARWTDALVVVGERDAEIGRTERIGDPERYVLVRSGIEVASFGRSVASRERAREAIDIPEGVPVIGTVTRLSRQKDPATFLAAVRQIVDARPDARCVIVGGGPLQGEVERLIDRFGLREQVSLLGPRDDVAALLPGFDVFLLSSQWEGLPRVVIEAMAAGVPVVSTDVGGVSEAVEDGVSGVLAPIGDAGALAKGVIRVFDDPGVAADMRRAAEARVQAFDTSVMMRQLEQAYLELLSETRRRPRRRRMARTVATASDHEAP